MGVWFHASFRGPALCTVRLQAAKAKAIQGGPWTLVHDGASGSKRKDTIDFAASSPQMIVHLATNSALAQARATGP